MRNAKRAQIKAGERGAGGEEVLAADLLAVCAHPIENKARIGVALLPKEEESAVREIFEKIVIRFGQRESRVG